MIAYFTLPPALPDTYRYISKINTNTTFNNNNNNNSNNNNDRIHNHNKS